MRLLCTGLSGLNKKRPLEAITAALQGEGLDVRLFNIGDMMYREDPRIAPGRILDLPYGQLRQLRRTVFRDILDSGAEHAIVNTHATFRWRTGLFAAFDVDQISAFGADLYLCFVEDVDQTFLRLRQTKSAESHKYSLKDLFVWREEELLATELMASIPQKKGQFVIIPLPDAEAIIHRLFTRPRLRRAYISFPITNVLGKPELMADIERFKLEMKKLFLAFDPFAVKESWMVAELEKIRSGAAGRDYMEVEFEGKIHRLPAAEVAPCVNDIEGQIVSRDLKLIDQSDILIAYMPDERDRPVNSPGVMREITHAAHSTKDVYIIWTSSKDPSPFIKDILPNPAAIFPDLGAAVDELKAVAQEPRQS